MLCWFNGPLQVFNYITRAYLERELRTVMNQPTDWSGIREVPKMLLDIICRAGEVQKLDKFRTLLIPEVRNANRTGPALRCLETLVEERFVSASWPRWRRAGRHVQGAAGHGSAVGHA